MFGVGVIGQVGGIGGGSIPPLQRFTYGVDFVAGTAIGGFQTYGNNTDDGRLFRDPTNVSAGFAPAANGLLVATSAAGLRRTTRGHWSYPTETILDLQDRDMTNAAWVKSGAGADVTVTKNQAGADGAANAACLVTFNNANGTVLQTITMASNTVVYTAYVKRVTGSGIIRMTVDGGTTWTDITAQIGVGAYAQAFITQAAVTNPVLGFQGATATDAIAVDFNQIYNPVNSLNLPNPSVGTTVGSTLFFSQSRPSANNADAAPKSLITTAQGNFAFFWQGRSMRPSGGFIITGATAIFCQVQGDGSVKFSANAGNATTGAGVWRSDNGLTQVNKVAGYFTGAGTIKIACNGSLGSGSGATTTPALDHFDLGTNGAGQNSIYGINEKFLMGPNLTFSDADLIAMTT